MRILAFCDYFSPDSSGGSERAAWEIYRRLAAKGARVRVITALPATMRPFESAKNLEVLVVPSLRLEGTIRLQASLAPSLFIKLRTLAAGFQADVIHANSLFFQTSLAAAAWQWSSGRPMVTTVHIGNLDRLSPLARLAARGYEWTLGRFILSRSQRVIGVSSSVAEHLRRLKINPDRITVVPNGVDVDRFRPRHPTEPANDPPVIAFVGRLISNKGPQRLLDALLQLQREGLRFKAVYLGDGPMRAELERRASTLAGSIDFRGHSNDVATELRGVDLLVRPSLTEGMPLTVLEAFATGVPVVASDIPGNRGLIADGENGVLVPVNQTEALAHAIRGLLQSPQDRMRLAAAGRATAQRYAWGRTADQTLQVFEEALEGDHAADDSNPDWPVERSSASGGSRSSG